MLYNIFTVVSKSYYPFLIIFLNSLYENVDLEKINKIYLVLIDMDEFIEDISMNEKVIIINHNSKDMYSGVHSEGWYENTKLKTVYLNKILSEISEDESLVLIDSDTMVCQDFSCLINKDFDIQITQMSEGSHISRAEVLISHIACFVIFNNIIKSRIFLKKWISEMEYLRINNKKLPHETPAMNMVLLDEETILNMKIESLDDRISCSDLVLYPETKILHFKSSPGPKNNPIDNFEKRVNLVKIKDKSRKNETYKKYLPPKVYTKWVNIVRK